MDLLNNTLREHLPSWLLPPKNNFEERRLVALAQTNCKRRMEFNYADDVLTAPEIVRVANDLLQSRTGNLWSTFNNHDLERYLTYGLIVPRYRVRPRMAALAIKRIFTFTPEGELQKITFSKEKSYPSLRPYRTRGAVTDAPAPLAPKTRDFDRGALLFTFAQVGVVVGIHWLVFRTVNILTDTPETYGQMRNDILTVLRKKGKAKCCENPTCFSLVPLGHRRFCSQPCRERAQRAKKPKSTPRVEKSYQRRAPFAFTAPADLPNPP